MMQEMTQVRFKSGDYVVCPGHGVGQVMDLETRHVGGNSISFYIIKIISNGLTVMVPSHSEAGARPLVNLDQIGDVYVLLKNHDVVIDNSTWNRRYRDYMNKIKTGSLIEIADVLRALFLLRMQKNLSFGEKKMLDQCKDLVAQEISLSSGESKKEICQKIESCFTVSEM